ncbi:MAG: arylsulfatase [Caldilineaceae bacterium]|nr:arylsulfatase [Caldilineaceae bacterium]
MAKQPNILFIMGDDIGINNLSCYSHGVMGYKTPNIDRLAKEGIMFTDFYAEQSCTAGRAAFITGQIPFRTGLTKVGVPNAKYGMEDETVTLAWALKDMGYRTGQFGKNHFGDRPEHLPTRHGFDEFYGVFYHLNAYEDPFDIDYPNDKDFPNFREKWGPKNLTHAWADGRTEDKGELTLERIQTIDDEFMAESKRFIKEAVDADEPFFVWHNTTHMHLWTQTKPESVLQAGRWQSRYHDTMIDHDKGIGELVDYLDELGIADDTVVVYTTDNGPQLNTWPDSGYTPFRNEKDTNWEGAFRVPCLARYPGTWREGEILNGITSLQDWFVTFCTLAGNPDIKEQLIEGKELAGKKFKQHLDGYDLNDYLSGKSEDSPRESFFYFTDDGDLAALRYDNWKLVFLSQDTPGTFKVWQSPFTRLRVPMLFNLRTDPYERASVASNTYVDWMYRKASFLAIPAQGYVANLLQTFKEFPPQQKPPSFTIDQAMETLQHAASNIA